MGEKTDFLIVVRSYFSGEDLGDTSLNLFILTLTEEQKEEAWKMLIDLPKRQAFAEMIADFLTPNTEEVEREIQRKMDEIREQQWYTVDLTIEDEEDSSGRTANYDTD